MQEQISELIIKGKLEKAARMMIEVARRQNPKLVNQLKLLLSQLKQARADARLRLSNTEDYEVRRSRIKLALLQLNDELFIEKEDVYPAKAGSKLARRWTGVATIGAALLWVVFAVWPWPVQRETESGFTPELPAEFNTLTTGGAESVREVSNNGLEEERSQDIPVRDIDAEPTAVREEATSVNHLHVNREDVDVALIVIDDQGQIDAVLGPQVARIFRNKGYSVSASYFKPEFFHHQIWRDLRSNNYAAISPLRKESSLEMLCIISIQDKKVIKANSKDSGASLNADFYSATANYQYQLIQVEQMDLADAQPFSIRGATKSSETLAVLDIHKRFTELLSRHLETNLSTNYRQGQ